MSKRKRLILAAAAAAPMVLALGLAKPASSFIWDPAWSWGRGTDDSDRVVCYYITSGANRRWGPGIRAAASTWNSAGARFRFVYRSNISDCAQENYFNKSNSSNFLPDSTLGLTETEVGSPSGIIRRQRTWLNTTYYGVMDGETVALHEFGHWLRLNEVSNSGPIMNNPLPVQHVQHSLAQDDKDGIRVIYCPSGNDPCPN